MSSQPTPITALIGDLAGAGNHQARILIVAEPNDAVVSQWASALTAAYPTAVEVVDPDAQGHGTGDHDVVVTGPAGLDLASAAVDGAGSIVVAAANPVALGAAWSGRVRERAVTQSAIETITGRANASARQVRTYAGFGDPASPGLLVAADLLDQGRAGIAPLVLSAFCDGDAGPDRYGPSPVAVSALARTGMLAGFADLLVWVATGDGAGAADSYSRDEVVSAGDVVPARPDAASLLHEAAAAGDEAAFRAIVNAVALWAAEPGNVLTSFGDVVIGGDLPDSPQVAAGVRLASRRDPGVQLRIPVAAYRFAYELVAFGQNRLWRQLTDPAQIAALVCAMAGDYNDHVLAAAARLAPQPQVSDALPATLPDALAVIEALQDKTQRSSSRAKQLAHTLDDREAALRVREARIRTLRAEVNALHKKAAADAAWLELIHRLHLDDAAKAGRLTKKLRRDPRAALRAVRRRLR